MSIRKVKHLGETNSSLLHQLAAAIAAHVADPDAHHDYRTYSLNTDNTIIQWDTDGVDNNDWQNIDLDSYFTVPTGAVAVRINVELRDGAASSLFYIGEQEDDAITNRLFTQVANVSHTVQLEVELATGNIIKAKGPAISPVNFSRIWIRTIGWWILH